MDFLQTLRAHVGGLIRLESQLFWYDGSALGWDGAPGRVCLILDVTDARFADARTTIAGTGGPLGGRRGTATALLLIDGTPRWICVSQADVELIA